MGVRPFAYLGGVCFMDFATGIGLMAGGIVLVTLILMGGDLRMFADTHSM